MCICTPSKRTPTCSNCFNVSIPSGGRVNLPKVEKIPPMPPVEKPPLCSLKSFYEAAKRVLTAEDFLNIVKFAENLSSEKS